MPNIPTQTTIYESYAMLHPDGTLMCRCNKKRANWYIDRNLATWIDETTFKLNFVPQGHGKSNNEYYKQHLENKCVVCGELNNLNKHHVFPYVFRSRLPVYYKESNHHDILAICINCHENYEDHATLYKMELASKYNASINTTMTEQQKINNKIRSAKKILASIKDGQIKNVPEDRIKLLEQKASEEIIGEEIPEGPVWADIIIKNVLDNDELFDFVRSWRKHFITHANPQYLPKLWSIDSPLEIIGQHERDKKQLLDSNE